MSRCSGSGSRCSDSSRALHWSPTTPWWQNLVAPLQADVTREWQGRTFAVVELLVRARWRRQHMAQRMHDLLLTGRPEERATLTVLPAAEAAQRAYTSWGWQPIARKRNPLPGSPVFDVMLRPLAGLVACSSH
jgi:hypothetical protein